MGLGKVIPIAAKCQPVTKSDAFQRSNEPLWGRESLLLAFPKKNTIELLAISGT
jgi:hypothetical protein